MSGAINQGAAKAAPAFDAAGWLATWADHGGIAIRTPDRLYVSRQRAIDSEAAGTLNQLRAAIFRPGAADALAAYLDRRSVGEVA